VNNHAIPDDVLPIVGYRVWAWDGKELKSLNGGRWSPGRALAAKCPTTNHGAPADGCSCGIYAAKDYQHLQKINCSVEYALHGEVYLWGKVVEHDLGYRAQCAYPKSLFLPSSRDRHWKISCLERLIVYGVDICLPPNILLWTKGSGYTSAGSDWRMGMERYKNQYNCPYGNRNCGENAIYCEPCNIRYEQFLWILNDDR
jgi:hypothetical protein